jgi:hypothetical protein
MDAELSSFITGDTTLSAASDPLGRAALEVCASCTRGFFILLADRIAHPQSDTDVDPVSYGAGSLRCASLSVSFIVLTRTLTAHPLPPRLSGALPTAPTALPVPLSAAVAAAAAPPASVEGPRRPNVLDAVAAAVAAAAPPPGPYTRGPYVVRLPSGETTDSDGTDSRSVVLLR